jgi:hypothetical protein
MNMSMCQLCKDPIWSFICPDCLAEDIRKWLPTKLKGAFSKFNEDFLASFSMTIDIDGLRCIHCRKIKLANICPFCYMAEVHEWLMHKNQKLANTILKGIPVTGDWFIKGGVCSWKDGGVPITETEMIRHEEGTCEACERFSEELLNVDGRLVCRDCHRSWQMYTGRL